MARKNKTRPRAAAASAAQQPSGAAGMAVRAQYEAASNRRRMADWRAPSSGPNKAIEGLPTIRNRNRDAGRNEWTSASAARVMVTSLVGTGIVARPKTKAAAIKKLLTAEWDRFVETSDADGVLDFYGQQAMAALSWFQAGECFGRFRARRITDGLPVPMQFQLLESDMVPMLDADTYQGLPARNRIRQGIELDPVGRRVAVWFHREHPGDKGSSFRANELVRVPINEVIHVFRPTRPGQLRGVPESAPILTKLRAVMNVDDNVLMRHQIANLFALFIKRPMPTGGESAIDPLTGKAVQYDAGGAPIASLEPGISQELLPGEDVVFSDPPDPGANYGDFMRQQHLGIAGGQGVPYELMAGDVRDVSDRTLRVIINEFRRWIEHLQWTILIPQLCRPVRAAWAQAAFIAGKIGERELAEASNTKWSPQAFAYIHPVQDVQARAAEVEAGFRSRSSVIAERGDDPEETDAERADDQEREKKYGITAAANAAPEVAETGDDDGEEKEGSNK